MLRDIELLRHILAHIEAAGRPLNRDELLLRLEFQLESPALDTLLTMLVEEAGFLTGVWLALYSGEQWIDLTLTQAGHCFLNGVRERHALDIARNAVWERADSPSELSITLRQYLTQAA